MGYNGMNIFIQYLVYVSICRNVHRNCEHEIDNVCIVYC